MNASVLAAWSFDPSVVVGCAALSIGRAAADGFRPRRGWVPFLAGTALLLLALTSPLDAFADEYSFSAHMLQHMILMLGVPPLWIVGAPAALVRRVLRRPIVSRVERAASAPAAACVAACAALFVWHVPSVYDAAVASEALHVVEHLCMLVAFTMYWWPALTPLPERRLSPGPAILHLAAGAIVTSAVGILITFAGPDAYQSYEAPADSLHVLASMRAAGFDRAADLALSGLMMWMAGTPAFLVAALAAIARWCREGSREQPTMVDSHE